MSELEQEITTLAASGGPAATVRSAVERLLNELESGALRAAVRDDRGYRAVPWVEQGILLGFRVGILADLGPSEGPFSFIDKDTFPTRRFTVADGIRVVPGGSTVRRGAYLAPGVVCMPPMFVNVGAYVGPDTMIDSHALVGSCAQIGARVHLSAGAQIGGVLEPVNAAPVVIEDDVLVGGNCGVYEGAIVRAGAVLAAGVILTRGTPVYDLVRETVYRAEHGAPLEIPAGAVVVPGARAVAAGWGREQQLAVQTPVVIKYRDEKTSAAVALESWLR